MGEKADLSIMQKVWALQHPKSLMHDFCLYHACPSNLEEFQIKCRQREQIWNQKQSV